jgi:hypothetical protein
MGNSLYDDGIGTQRGSHADGRRRHVSCALLLTAAVLLNGCGGDRGPERAVVSGAVTYNGQTVPDGAIRFVPAAGSAMPTCGAAIVAGKYEVAAKGGVPVGTHTVQIEGYRRFANAAQSGTAESSPPAKFELQEQYLPKKFNANSTLKITIAPGSGAITKNFDLAD